MNKLHFAIMTFLISGAAHGAQAVPFSAPANDDCAEILERANFGFTNEQLMLGQLMKPTETLAEHQQRMKAADRQALMYAPDSESLAVMRENIAALLDKTAGVRADWNSARAMAYPRPSSPVNRMSAIPSLFGRGQMLDLDGKAYIQLKVYDATYGRFLNQVYPVVKLSSTGNPVLFIHPDNHLLIPTVKEVKDTAELFAPATSVGALSKEDPVRVKLYGGQNHGGLFTQLIVSKGHRLAFAAVHRHEPFYIEITDLSSYREVDVTWKTMLMTGP